MHIALSDRPKFLFSLGLQLLNLKHKALEIHEDELAKAIDAATAEVDILLVQLMEDQSDSARQEVVS